MRLLARSTFPPSSRNPPALPPPPATGPALKSAYLKPEQGQVILRRRAPALPRPPAWDAYGHHVRERMQAARSNLSPWPKRTPLHPIVHSRRVYDGYSVENVILDTIPGYFLAGNLYRPLGPLTPRSLSASPESG